MRGEGGQVNAPDHFRPAGRGCTVQREALLWRGQRFDLQLQIALWCGYGGQLSAVWPAQPATVDQQPSIAGVVVEYLQYLDARPAITGAVVEQPESAGVE